MDTERVIMDIPLFILDIVIVHPHLCRPARYCIDIFSIFVYMIATGTKIDLPLREYSVRRNVQCKECYLLLQDKVIQYKVVSEHECLNEDTDVWELQIANWRWTRQRVLISDVNMYYNNKEQMWSVGIEFSGVGGECAWWYTDPKEALKVYNQLTEYMIGGSNE